MAIDYKQSGVNIEAGDQLVDWLRKNPAKTNINNPNLVAGIGGFASLFKADFSSMNKPCLVSCTDGVGTKLKLATKFGSYQEVAQDLVAMCVNDMICCGAKPLFFLDYYSCGRLDLDSAKDFLTGVRLACEQSDCALIGGETAEMPGVYAEGDFDCAGFSVGVVDQDKAKGAHLVQEGDVVIGLGSSGFHSNGYSLVRKLFAEDLNEYRDQLIQPTHLYVDIVLKLLESKLAENIHSMAHITGGGIQNLSRVIPDSLGVDLKAWAIPDLFLEAKKRGELSFSSLLSTFNCGVGYCLITTPEAKDEVLEFVSGFGYKAFEVGQVVKTKAEGSSVTLPQGWRDE